MDIGALNIISAQLDLMINESKKQIEPFLNNKEFEGVEKEQLEKTHQLYVDLQEAIANKDIDRMNKLMKDANQIIK
jgi:hypothetical protein